MVSAELKPEVQFMELDTDLVQWKCRKETSFAMIFFELCIQCNSLSSPASAGVLRQFGIHVRMLAQNFLFSVVFNLKTF